MSPRVLLLSYAFPPMALPESALSAKRLANLGPDVDVDVVCAPPFREFMGDDHSLDEYVDSRFASVTRIPVPAVLRRAPLGRMGSIVERPDFMRLLNRTALAAATPLAERADAVVTWSQWHSMHLVGLELRQRRPGLRWVAHFSDPWVDNPYQPLPPRRRARMLELEQRVVHGADALSVTSSETADLLARGDAGVRAKIEVLPHAFEPDLYPPAPAASDGPIVLRHIGQLYGIRTPEALFDALRLVAADEPAVLDGVTIELVGRADETVLATAGLASLPPGLVRVVAPVTYVASLLAMGSADGLIVIDADADHNVFLPSKVVDYLGARRPILAITPPGPTARLVADAGGHVSGHEPVAVAASLRGLLASVRADRGARFGGDALVDEYRADRVGARMRRLLAL